MVHNLSIQQFIKTWDINHIFEFQKKRPDGKYFGEVEDAAEREDKLFPLPTIFHIQDR